MIIIAKLKEKMMAMIGVRKMIALSLTFVFCYKTIAGSDVSQEFLTVFSMVLGYYFGRSTALDQPFHKEEVTVEVESEEEVLG